MKTFLYGSAAALAFVLVSACTSTRPAPEAALAPQAAGGEDVVEAPAAAPIDYSVFVETTERPETDILADAARKPAAVLAFFAPQPGDKILEVEAGAGYFTEILSRTVGAEGTVYMQNPAGFAAFLGDKVSKRVDGRLANVRLISSNFDAFGLEDGAVDTVTWFQGPHELAYFPDDQPEGFGEPAAVYAEIARVLKPGGEFVVIDHIAPAGSPETTGGETHRVDPAIIKAYAAAVGMTLEAESNLLVNPDDDGTKNVFDPEIRGHTSQSLMVFRKP